MNENELLKMFEKEIRKTNDLLQDNSVRLKRIETKMTSAFEASGYDTHADNNKKSALTYTFDESGVFIIKLDHTDVKMSDLIKFTDNFFGEIHIVFNGEVLWKIEK